MSNQGNDTPPGDHDRPFATCKEELLSVLGSNDINLERDVITSRDAFVSSALQELQPENIHEGFTKWRLPFFIESEGVNFYLSSANSGTKVEKHSHDHGPVVRFILEGSIQFGNEELTTGDWIYVPAKVDYEFTVGPRGASFILGYRCCC